MGLKSIPAWKVFLSIVLLLNFFQHILPAQRIFLPPSPDPAETTGSSSNPALGPPGGQTSQTLILKTYPNGTKKVVPLEALNFRDDGATYGGPPHLSLYEPSPAPALSRQSPERLAIAPIGNNTEAVSIPASIPASPDLPFPATQLLTAAPDPMGGAPAPNPMGGASSAPRDPLAGAPSSVPPLQTISGKPAPVVGSSDSVQMGAWDSFFMNAAVGAALQGQLNASRVYNGDSRQAYPYQYPIAGFGTALVNGESFTFQPGFRFDLEFGYQFNDCLGVFLETGIIYNGLDTYQVNLGNSVTVPTPGGNAVFPPGNYTFNATGDLTQVPVQLNFILRWPGEMACKPFFGAGLGTVWQQLDVNTFNAGPLDLQGGYTRSGFQFGWNAQLGLTYTVDTALDFYAAFKMISAVQPVIGNYQFESGYNLGVVIGIQSRF